jgi:hypothetical protein
MSTQNHDLPKYTNSSTLQRLLSQRVGGTEIPPKILKRFLKPTDMTTHWKALEHFLMVPLVFRFSHSGEKNIF